MADKKQYLRKINPGDVSVEGRQSNGFTADKKGNVIFYSALKDSELDYLDETQNKDDIPLYYGNSYFGIIKSETHNTLNLGNNNYETLNEKVDANKIITADNNPKSPKVKAILIGDSQTPYVDKNSTQSSRLTDKGGKSSLWEGGKGVSWLIEALTEYSGDPEVTHVVTVIGTNGGFGKFAKDDIPKLFSLIKTKFPKAVVLTVQGSWGWGGLKNITEKEVRDYYKQYEKQGAILVEPPIGAIEPHGDKPVYKLIGKQIDEIISKNVVPTVTATPTPQVATPLQQEEKLPTAAPPPDEEQVDEFVFLEDQESELAPTQLTAFIDTTVNNNEELTIEDLRREKKEEEEINKREKKREKIPTGDKVGSIKVLIQNNSKDYSNLGDIIYHSTPLYSQSDPEWGSYKSGDLKMSSHGCCYTTICMLLGNATKDASKTTPYSVWNSGKPNTKSVLVYFDSLAAIFGKSIKVTSGSLDGIDNILKSKPVGFEWSSKKGWPKGYNLYKGNKKGNYKGDSKGISYTCCNQHWMVITGKNSDGTYTVFDPAGGVIRKNQSRGQIEAGLERIAYVN